MAGERVPGVEQRRPPWSWRSIRYRSSQRSRGRSLHSDPRHPSSRPRPADGAYSFGAYSLPALPTPGKLRHMKITDIVVHRLVGGTVDGGWPQGHEPRRRPAHAGGGHHRRRTHAASAACSPATAWCRPASSCSGRCGIGESADRAGARHREAAADRSFWQGRGGSVEHAISGIDIALWDIFGKVCGQPVSRLLGGNYRTRIKPYGSILFDEPAKLRDTLQAIVARGFKAIKLGWRPFGRRNRAVRRAADPDGPRDGRRRTSS